MSIDGGPINVTRGTWTLRRCIAAMLALVASAFALDVRAQLAEMPYHEPNFFNLVQCHDTQGAVVQEHGEMAWHSFMSPGEVIVQDVVITTRCRPPLPPHFYRPVVRVRPSGPFGAEWRHYQWEVRSHSGAAPVCERLANASGSSCDFVILDPGAVVHATTDDIAMPDATSTFRFQIVLRKLREHGLAPISGNPMLSMAATLLLQVHPQQLATVSVRPYTPAGTCATRMVAPLQFDRILAATFAAEGGTPWKQVDLVLAGCSTETRSVFVTFERAVSSIPVGADTYSISNMDANRDRVLLQLDKNANEPTFHWINGGGLVVPIRGRFIPRSAGVVPVGGDVQAHVVIRFHYN